MKKPLLVLVLAVLALVAASADSPPRNGLSLDVGLGWSPYINYPSQIQTEIDTTSESPNIQKTQINVNLDLGVPLWQEYQDDVEANRVVYLSAGLGGYATRLTGPYGFYQLNNYLAGVGVQVKTGPVVSVVHFGQAWAVSQLESTTLSGTGRSKDGLGVAFRTSFTTTRNAGLGLSFGLVGQVSSIEDQLYTALGLAVSVNLY